MRSQIRGMLKLLSVASLLILFVSADLQVSVRQWLDTPENSLIFPETRTAHISERPNNGLCFIGGGNRAYTAEIGFLRALNTMGLLSSVKYMAGVSGGSWALTGFRFRQTATSDTEFLEPHVPTSQLTLSKLAEMPGNLTMAYTIASLSVLNVATASPATQLFFQLLQPSEAVKLLYGPHANSSNWWTDGVHDVYLKPHGIPSSQFFSWDFQTVSTILARNPDLDRSMFLLPKPNGSFPIVLGVAIGPLDLAALQPNVFGDGFTNVEFTPLYSGVANPVTRTFSNNVTTLNLNFGGYVESFAFGGTPVTPPITADAPWAGLSNMTIPFSSRNFSLADMVGISSMALGSVYATQSAATRVYPNLTAWDLVPRFDMYSLQDMNPKPTSTMLGDGGLLDVTGIIALLRRNVQNIIVCDSNSEPLNGDTAFLSLFGYDPRGPSMLNDGEDHQHNQVFALADMQMFNTTIVDALKAGTAPIATFEIKTVENTWFGIKANQTVRLTWIYVELYSDWLYSLPTETRQALSNLTTGNPFANFPHYKTDTQFILTASQVNLLAALTCDTMMSDPDQIKYALGLTDNKPTSDDGKKGLSKGAIAGIVLAVFAGVALLVGVVYYVRNKKSRSHIGTHKAESLMHSHA